VNEETEQNRPEPDEESADAIAATEQDAPTSNTEAGTDSNGNDADAEDMEPEKDPQTPAAEADEQCDGEAGDKERDAGEADEPDVDDEAGGNPAEELLMPLESIVEALLMAAPEPKTARELARAVGKGMRSKLIEEAVTVLNAKYLETERAFEIVKTGDHYQVMTLPEYAPHVMELLGKKIEPRKLSPAALDTLAIVAYRQPIMRVDVERIRGVQAGPVLRNLLEAGLIAVVGKNTELLGHPVLYGTTGRFLESFGIGSLDELPNIDELRAP
jgi:segregation and condensation protein B